MKKLVYTTALLLSTTFLTACEKPEKPKPGDCPPSAPVHLS